MGMNLREVKALCKKLRAIQGHEENFYLIKYASGWAIGTPNEFTTDNKLALDAQLYTL